MLRIPDEDLPPLDVSTVSRHGADWDAAIYDLYRRGCDTSEDGGQGLMYVRRTVDRRQRSACTIGTPWFACQPSSSGPSR